MNEVGYGQQPYLMYRHNDTQHPHMHIVTVSVDARGCKISDQFIKNRLNRIRQNIEKRHGLVGAEQVGQHEFPVLGDTQQNSQQQPIGKLLKQTLDEYAFGSVESFRQFLSLKNIRVNVAAGRSKLGMTFQMMQGEVPITRPVKASSFEFRPTQSRLEKRFSAQREEHVRGCNQMAGVIHWRLNRYINLTEAEYKTTLQQVGIRVHSRGGGYLYIQERSGLVALETELPDTLHKRSLLARFADQTEHKPTIPGEVLSKLQLGSAQTISQAITPSSPPAKQQILSTPLIHQTPINDLPSLAAKPQPVVEDEPLRQADKSLPSVEQLEKLPVKSKKERKNKRKTSLRL